MSLRLFPLPLTDRTGPEAIVAPPPSVRGWTWFQPAYDGEKIGLLSDAGVLGLFGVQQTGDSDALLYPRLGAAGLNLDPFLKPTSKNQGRADGGVQGDDFWVLAHGQLQHLQMVWNAALDRVRWRSGAPLSLGSPLHSSQVFQHKDGTTLVLVTQSLTDPSCLATAVDAETGSIHWQRQLGFVCRGTPLELRLPNDKTPVLLVQDQSGSLFVFDRAGPLTNPARRGACCRPIEDNPKVYPLLIAAADGISAYQVACPGTGTTMLFRHIQLGADRQVRVLTDKRVPLNAPIQGTPAVVGNLLVAPLADGTLAAWPLPLERCRRTRHRRLACRRRRPRRARPCPASGRRALSRQQRGARLQSLAKEKGQCGLGGDTGRDRRAAWSWKIIRSACRFWCGLTRWQTRPTCASPMRPDRCSC